MNKRIFLVLAFGTIVSLACQLAFDALQVPALTLVLAPDVRRDVDSADLDTSADILQERISSADLKGKGHVHIVNGNIQIDLTNVDDEKLMTPLVTRIGKLIFLDSADLLVVGGAVPENPKIIMSNGDIAMASVVASQITNMYNVALTLTPDGAKKLADYSRASIGRYLVISLDDIVIMSPMINGPIEEGQAIIEGNLTREEAVLLAAQLRTMPLPFPFRIVDRISHQR
jgi:preprotein translocase subunit SecD